MIICFSTPTSDSRLFSLNPVTFSNSIISLTLEGWKLRQRPAGGQGGCWHWHWDTMYNCYNYQRQSHIIISKKNATWTAGVPGPSSGRLNSAEPGRMTNSPRFKLNSADSRKHDLYCQPLTSQYLALQFVPVWKGSDSAWNGFELHSAASGGPSLKLSLQGRGRPWNTIFSPAASDSACGQRTDASGSDPILWPTCQPCQPATWPWAFPGQTRDSGPAQVWPWPTRTADELESSSSHSSCLAWDWTRRPACHRLSTAGSIFSTSI